MPRTPLKALLRDLKGAGVVRYRNTKLGIELEFGSTMEIREEERQMEGDDRRESMKARPDLRDPLRTALDDKPFELEEEDAN